MRIFYIEKNMSQNDMMYTTANTKHIKVNKILNIYFLPKLNHVNAL